MRDGNKEQARVGNGSAPAKWQTARLRRQFCTFRQSKAGRLVPLASGGWWRTRRWRRRPTGMAFLKCGKLLGVTRLGCGVGRAFERLFFAGCGSLI